MHLLLITGLNKFTPQRSKLQRRQVQWRVTRRYSCFSNHCVTIVCHMSADRRHALSNHVQVWMLSQCWWLCRDNYSLTIAIERFDLVEEGWPLAKAAVDQLDCKPACGFFALLGFGTPHWSSLKPLQRLVVLEQPEHLERSLWLCFLCTSESWPVAPQQPAKLLHASCAPAKVGCCCALVHQRKSAVAASLVFLGH